MSARSSTSRCSARRTSVTIARRPSSHPVAWSSGRNGALMYRQGEAAADLKYSLRSFYKDYDGDRSYTDKTSGSLGSDANFICDRCVSDAWYASGPWTRKA